MISTCGGNNVGGTKPAACDYLLKDAGALIVTGKGQQLVTATGSSDIQTIIPSLTALLTAKKAMVLSDLDVQTATVTAAPTSPYGTKTVVTGEEGITYNFGILKKLCNIKAVYAVAESGFSSFFIVTKDGKILCKKRVLVDATHVALIPFDSSMLSAGIGSGFFVGDGDLGTLLTIDFGSVPKFIKTLKVMQLSDDVDDLPRSEGFAVEAQKLSATTVGVALTDCADNDYQDDTLNVASLWLVDGVAPTSVDVGGTGFGYYVLTVPSLSTGTHMVEFSNPADLQFGSNVATFEV